MAMFVVIIIAKLRLRKEGRMIADAFQSLGWENIRKCRLGRWGERYLAMLNGKILEMEYGIPDRGKPCLIRISFPTEAAGRFTIKRRPVKESLPFFMKPLFPSPELDFSAPEFILEGKDPNLLRRRLEGQDSAILLRESMPTLNDCIRFKKNMIIIDKPIFFPSKERLLGEPIILRQGEEALKECAKVVDGILRLLMAVGF